MGHQERTEGVTRSVALAAAGSWCLALLACSSLQHFPAGACGNGVLEAGEDCDGEAGPGPCGEPGDATHACRLLCEAADDCPPGWACAPSGSCHHAEGAFTPMFVTEPTADEWRVGDLDGDGAPDLVRLDAGGPNAPGELGVNFGTGEGVFGATTSLRLPSGSARTLDVRSVGGVDALDAAVVATPSGILVVRGQQDQRLSPSVGQPFQVVSGGHDAWVLFVHLETPGDSVLGLLAGNGGIELRSDVLSGALLAGAFATSSISADDPLSLTDLGSRLPMADLDGDHRDEFALAFDEDHFVWVAAIRRHPVWGHSYFQADSQELDLPAGLAIGDRAKRDLPRLFADVDGDGDVDLLIPAYDNLRSCVVLVAANGGNGALGALQEDPRFADCPLAAGELDGDARADFVLPVGVGLAVEGALEPADPEGSPRDPPWQEALIVDLDRDGADEVVATAPDVRGLEILRGAPPIYWRTIDLEGEASLLRAGDVDGDGTTDLVFRQRRQGVEGDDLGVLYGGALEDGPIVLGPLGPIVRLEVGLGRQGTQVDRAEDIVAMIGDDGAAQSAVIVPGSADRTLLTGYALWESQPYRNFSDRPTAVFAGRFDGDDGTDVLALGGATGELDLWRLSGQRGSASLGRASRLGTLADQLGCSSRDGSCAEWAACARWAWGDADGDGLDEIVGVAPGGGCGHAERPTLVVNLSGSAALGLSHIPEPTTAIRIADLDADGCGEIVSVGSEGLAVRWCGDWDVASTSGPPDAAAVVVVEADGDPDPELAVLADGGVWLVDVGAAGASRSLALRGEPVLAATGDRLEAADANLDGLSDLWVGGPAGVELYESRSSIEGGAR